ncbi:MAG: hypothetical protein QM601_05135 [Pseudoxanthomonas sp.]
MRSLSTTALCLLLLAACGDNGAQQQAQAAAEQAQRQQAAQQLADQFDQAVTAQNWEMARVHGSALLDQYRDTPAAGHVLMQMERVRQRAQAAQEQRRLAALWNYAQVPVGKGSQRSAMIDAQQRVDTDGKGPKTVQLVFRDHPAWGRSAYLVLQAGDFAKACYRHCSVNVSVDGAAHRTMAANRPDTKDAIAMFIDDDKALWKLAGQAKQTLSITFPVQAGGTRTAVFETGGLDKTQMPGW